MHHFLLYGAHLFFVFQRELGYAGMKMLRRLIQQHVTPIRKSSARMMRECICFVQSSPARNYEPDLARAVVQDLEHLTTMISAAESQLLEQNYPSLVSLAGALQELSHSSSFRSPG
ncbi:hypothetical protein quinque_015764 [Culex quinquefasciatus]